jgi:hypothetical protein
VLHLLAAPEPLLGSQNFGLLTPAVPGSLRSTVPARPGSAQVPPALITALRSFDNTFGGIKLSLLLQGVLWCLMLLPRLSIALALTLLTFARRCGSLLGARIALAFATWLAAFALPRLVRKGAMGADEGRFVRVSNLPPGVAGHESLDDDVALAARLVGRDLGGLAGSSLLGAIGSQDAFSIKRYIEEALSNAALAHSYYYKDPKIIAATAAAIAAMPRSSA